MYNKSKRDALVNSFARYSLLDRLNNSLGERYAEALEDASIYSAQKGLETLVGIPQSKKGFRVDAALTLAKNAAPRNSCLYRILKATGDGMTDGFIAGFMIGPEFWEISIPAGVIAGGLAYGGAQAYQELDTSAYRAKPKNATPSEMLAWEHGILASSFTSLTKDPGDRLKELDTIYRRMMQIEYLLDENAPFQPKLNLDGQQSISAMDNDRMWWSINSNIEDTLYSGAPTLDPGGIPNIWPSISSPNAFSNHFDYYGDALPTGIDWSYPSTYDTSLISQKQAAYRMAISAMLEREALGPNSATNLIQVDSLSPFIPKSSNSLYDEISYLDFGDFGWPDEPSVSTGPTLDTSLSSYLYPNAGDVPDWVYKIGTSSLKILGDDSRQQKQPDPIGTAISTAYDIMSFGNTLTDVISGRRDDPGAYLSLANYAAQGLNWAAKSDAVQDVVGSLAGYNDSLTNVSNVTGGALAGWGLYQNIAGLTSGEIDVKDVLGVAANTGQLYNSLNSLLSTTDKSFFPTGLNGTMGALGKYGGGALSAIGLYEGIKGLVEGDPQNPMSIIGLANNAYNVYSMGASLIGGQPTLGGGLATALFGEAGLATTGATTFLGLAAAPLLAMTAAQILSALTYDGMNQQDAQELIASNADFLGRVGAENSLQTVDQGAPRRLRSDLADSINYMEKIADRAGYSQEQVHGMIGDELGYLAPGAISAANRMEYVDTLFSEDNMASLANPDNWWDRQTAIEGAFQIGDFLGASREEMAPLDKAWTWENDQDQLEFMVEKLKELASQVVEVDAGVASLQSNFQFLGENLGLSAETIPVFNEQLTVLASQFVQGQIGVDGFADGVQSIASGLGLSNEQGAALVQTVLAMVAPLIQGGSAAGALGSGVGGAADALDRALGAGQGLLGTMGGLGGALTEGGNTAGAAGAAIDAGLTPAMLAARLQAQALAEEAQQISGSIADIPTTWESNLYFTRYFQTVGTPFHDGGLVFHSGGLVLHDGGLAGPRRFHDGGWFDELLAPFEVPAILQRGEYVVRQSSVNAQTLPWLRMLNQTGDLPDSGSGSAININAPLVQVQGGLTSDPDAIENLARLVEAKLKDLQAGRFGREAAYL